MASQIDILANAKNNKNLRHSNIST